MRRPRITYNLAYDFFEALGDNEESMGEMAALAVTLNEFGFSDDDFDAVAEMAEVMENHAIDAEKERLS